MKNKKLWRGFQLYQSVRCPLYSYSSHYVSLMLWLSNTHHRNIQCRAPDSNISSSIWMQMTPSSLLPATYRPSRCPSCPYRSSITPIFLGHLAFSSSFYHFCLFSPLPCLLGPCNLPAFFFKKSSCLIFFPHHLLEGASHSPFSLSTRDWGHHVASKSLLHVIYIWTSLK